MKACHVVTLVGPTLVGPTLVGPPLVGPTLVGPTLVGPTLANPPRVGPTLVGPPLVNPPLVGPTLVGPTLVDPTLVDPTLVGPPLVGPTLVGPPRRTGHQVPWHDAGASETQPTRPPLPGSLARRLIRVFFPPSDSHVPSTCVTAGGWDNLPRNMDRIVSRVVSLCKTRRAVSGRAS